jgi:hypothetical protein
MDLPHLLAPRRHSLEYPGEIGASYCILAPIVVYFTRYTKLDKFLLSGAEKPTFLL